MSKLSQWIRVLEGFIYTVLSPLLLCAKAYPSESIHNRLSTHVMSDEKIADLAISSKKVDANSLYISKTLKYNSGYVARITSDAVTKALFRNGELELHTTNFVRKSTCIPIPLCDRLVKSAGRGSWLVQEFVPGRTVYSAWPELGWWQRFRIALTLRYYIYQLRSLDIGERMPIFPGPLAFNGSPNTCTGRLFTSDGAGPFLTYRDLARWYQNRLLVMQKFRKEGLGTMPFDDSAPLVFTHFDLHPQNLILGDDDQLWVIDWEDAGWYPPWFEAASMQLFLCNRPLGNLQGWKMWIPFIAGRCESPGQLPFILAISYSLEFLKSTVMNLIDNTAE